MLLNSRYNVKTNLEDNKLNSQKKKFKSRNEKTKFILKTKRQTKINCDNHKVVNNYKRPSSLTRNKIFANKYLRCRFTNKLKTVELEKNTNKHTKSKPNIKRTTKLPPPSPPYEYRIASSLGQAIMKDDSPKQGNHLHVRQVVVKALKEGISWPTIECLLLACGWQQKINENCFLLEICFRNTVFLILSVRTNNILQLKKDLSEIFNGYNARFESILHYFRHNCWIQALAYYKTSNQFASFEKTLAKDAVELQATGVEILDYETGAVNLKCNPIELPTMVRELEKRRYKILCTDYGFKALSHIKLNEEVSKKYNEFINDLRKFPEVEIFFDNVKIVGDSGTKKYQKLKNY